MVLLLGIGASAAAAAPAPGPALKADYTFDGGYASSLPGAPDLVQLVPLGSIVSATVNGSPDNVYKFPVGGGLSFDPTGVIERNTYSVIVDFEFDANALYRRILSFNTFASNDDNGLYGYSGFLDFYDDNTAEELATTSTLADGVYSEVAFSRSADGTVAAFEDGDLQLVHGDTFGEGVISSDGLRFFKDNGAEQSAGSVARIRIYDGDLSPQQVADIHETGGLRAGAVKSGKPKLRGHGQKLKVKTGIMVTCPAEGFDCPLFGDVTEPDKGPMGTRLGSIGGNVPAGTSKTLTIKLSKKGVKRVGKDGKVNVVAQAAIEAGSLMFSSVESKGRI